MSVFLVWFALEQKELNQQKIVPILPKTPRIPNLYKAETDIVLEIQSKDFNFPSEENLLISSKQKPYTEDEIVNLSNKFGFVEEPITANDIHEGKTYIWSNQKGNLTIYSKSRRLTFTTQDSINTANKQLSDAEIEKIAEDFLYSHSLLEPGSVKFDSFTYLSSDEASYRFIQSNKQKANVYQVNFSIQSSRYPILSINPLDSPINVSVLTDGKVYKFEFSDIENFKDSPEKFSLMNFAEFKENINKATVISLKNGLLNPEDIPPGSIEQITIDNVSLVYLFDSNFSTNYQPVFLLTGSASLVGLDEKIEAKLYLPALKGY